MGYACNASWWSLFGFLGMLLGIPTFGVIYKLISRSTTNKLKSKDISFK